MTYDAIAAECVTEVRELKAERDALAERADALHKALVAAIRAAELGLFVIRKHGVMPNDSWRAGFERDLAAAKSALAAPSAPKEVA